MNRMHTWITIGFCMVTVFAKSDLNKGYYWRGYNQEIPKDAFIAFTNQLGEYIYVAKKVHISNRNDYTTPYPFNEWTNYFIDMTSPPPVLSKCHDYELRVIVPGQIRKGKNTILYEWGYEAHEADKDFQILCTQQPKDFEWLKTSIGEDFLNMTESRHLVPAGVEDDQDTYIGRITDWDNSSVVLVGKVVYTQMYRRNVVFCGTIDGRECKVRHYAIEILVYNPPK